MIIKYRHGKVWGYIDKLNNVSIREYDPEYDVQHKEPNAKYPKLYYHFIDGDREPRVIRTAQITQIGQSELLKTDTIEIVTNQETYLMTDLGKTIERLV